MKKSITSAWDQLEVILNGIRWNNLSIQKINDTPMDRHRDKKYVCVWLPSQKLNTDYTTKLITEEKETHYPFLYELYLLQDYQVVDDEKFFKKLNPN